MGKASRNKKLRAEIASEIKEPGKGTDVGSSLVRWALLAGVPLLTGVFLYVGLYVVESDFFVGISGLAGAALWIVVLLSDLGKSIPPSGRSSGASIDFGAR